MGSAHPALRLAPSPNVSITFVGGPQDDHHGWWKCLVDMEGKQIDHHGWWKWNFCMERKIPTGHGFTASSSSAFGQALIRSKRISQTIKKGLIELFYKALESGKT
jgi:pantoate kinase